MTKHLSVMRFLSVVLLLDIVLIGLVSFTGTNADTILSGFLPGKFGPGMGANMTGNHLLGALIVMLDAVLFLLAGFLALLGTAGHALMIGSGGIARLLRGRAGLSQEEIAATSFAVAEEQKSEIRQVHTGRNLVWIGAVLLLLAFPAVCFTFAQADVKGAPLLQDAGGAVANTAVSIEDSVVFAADQLADAVLLDVPRVFQWHLTSLTPGHSHRWLRPFVLLYHILDKLIVLASLFAAWRGGHLRAYVLQMTGLDAAVPMLATLREAPAQAAVAPPPEAPPVHQRHEDPPSPGPSIIDVPVYVEHGQLAPVAHAPEPEHPALEEPALEEPAPEAPKAVDASILDVPVYVDPPLNEEHHHSEAPLALHELKDPANEAPVADSGEKQWEGSNIHPFPYRNTALHLDQHEFDA